MKSSALCVGKVRQLLLVCFFVFGFCVGVFGALPRTPLPFWCPKRKRKKNWRLHRFRLSKKLDLKKSVSLLKKVRQLLLFCFLFLIFMPVYSGLCPRSPLPFWCPKRKRKRRRRLRRLLFLFKADVFRRSIRFFRVRFLSCLILFLIQKR